MSGDGALAPSSGDQLALEELRRTWGVAYTIGFQSETGYFAALRGRIGHMLTAASADELQGAILADSAPPAATAANQGRRAGGAP